MYLLLLRGREPNRSFSERKKIYSKSEKPEGLIDSYAYDYEITLLMRFFRSSVTSETTVRRRNPPGQKTPARLRLVPHIWGPLAYTQWPALQHHSCFHLLRAFACVHMSSSSGRPKRSYSLNIRTRMGPSGRSSAACLDKTTQGRSDSVH
jgi:hypothetical protein